MAVNIKVSVYTNSDDAFVAWAPSAFIPGCRGFLLERASKTRAGEKVVQVENRLGFKKDKPKSGDHEPSSKWPFQRFNWTDHAVNVGNEVRYRVTAMIDDGSGRPYKKGVASNWTPWATLTPDAGGGFSCYFNRGLVLSQFVARYLKDKKLTPAAFKAQLKKSVDPKFRAFLAGDLGARLLDILSHAKDGDTQLHAALYELGDTQLEDAMIALKSHLHLILANGSDKSGDGNRAARQHLNDGEIPTINRLLKSKGLGHNKFAVLSDAKGPRAVWTGSTNWSTTGLCTQINNALLIEHKGVAKLYRQQWDRLQAASPPELDPAGFPAALVDANDTPHTLSVGKAQTTVWFTRTSDGRDMDALRELISSAKDSILFLMFSPGKQGLHTLIGQRANETNMYVRGVVSTLGNETGDSDKSVLDVRLLSSDRKFAPDRYTIVQPQGVDTALGPWLAEVTRKNFLSQVGHAIVHSKVLVIDPLSDNPVVVTGSHNFSAPASEKNDENLVIVRGQKKLARAYAAYVMSVYQHYRYRSYIREMLAQGKIPWSYLDDDDQWLKDELKSKALEIGYWS
ncbi:phosphatidylserine/phosphatidylglycerophosphate/cardiolipi n synthases and related enzymes [Sulfuriferula multivorans]|uniref:phospholipase D n=2 Tax=Sulfuriferula multivorans TaxID=1559896 RepID=A0A401JYY5_9PROT|nr:phosphatidylserine/phosphatidylglycerophosphate/cardiolipi n synthases and related enzymes [Sulfuriferula multivorans]